MRGRARGLKRRRVLTVALAGGLLLAGVGAVYAGVRLARDGVLPGVVVGDTPLGGLDQAELRTALGSHASRRGADPLTVTGPLPRSAGDALRVDATDAQLGYALDVEATADAVWARGRQDSPVEALVDHVRAFGATTEVDPVESVDEGVLAAWVSDAVDDLALAPVEGDVVIAGAAVERVEPRPGAEVDTAALTVDLRSAAARPRGPSVVPASTVEVPPATTPEAVESVAALAERAVSAPVVLRRGDVAVQVAPESIGDALEVVPDGAQLRLELPAEAVAGAVGDTAAFDVAPVDATVRLEAGPSGPVPTVVDGTDGFGFDDERAAAQLLAVATGGGPRDVTLEGEVVAPERTSDEARALQITQPVSSFTTQHPAGQSRVTNIHRIADLIRGVVVDPGEVFSVNDFVGRRTTENGFVGGGAIQEGEFVEEVGGGVSQFATTMYNAAFFGGYEIVEHKPHSQYISRYPEGREATLNFPNVDLKIGNNSPHGLLIDTSYTDTSITVTLWATTWVQVTDQTGPRRNFRGPETIVRSTDELPPGAERVVQAGGGQGFDVTVTRTLTFPDGRVETEDEVTSYMAEPRIVERGR